MNTKYVSIPILLMLLSITLVSLPVLASSQSCDIGTLACKVQIVNNTPGLYVKISNFVQSEADEGATVIPSPTTPITPTFVLSSGLDGNSIKPPDVTVNPDTAAAT